MNLYNYFFPLHLWYYYILDFYVLKICKSDNLIVQFTKDSTRTFTKLPVDMHNYSLVEKIYITINVLSKE